MANAKPRDRADSAAAPSSHPAPQRTSIRSSMLWFGLLGGPIAWSVQTLANTAIAAHGCYPQLFPLHASATPGMRGILFGVSLVMIAVAVAALATSWSSWRRTRTEHQDRSGAGRAHGHGTAALETGEGRTRFMALAGFMTSVTFLIVIVAHTAAVLVVIPCAG